MPPDQQPLLEIVDETEDLLVINKPAGLVCHPTKGDEYSSLISRVRLYLRRRPGESAAHLVNRLDRETSGLVLVAKTDPAAANLRRRWERGEVTKTYSAIVEGLVGPSEGNIDLPIGPDTASRVVIKGCVRQDGAPSFTSYRCVRKLECKGEWFSVLEVSPRTGRKHQIRIHLAHIGHPIVGDKLYGWSEDCYLALVEGRLTDEQWQRLRLENHALHAGHVRWDEPEGNRAFAAPLNSEMQRFIDDGRTDSPAAS